MSSYKRIYCEGKKGSHDYDIIEKVIDGLNDMEIVPIGGKRGAKSVIQVKEQGLIKSKIKVFFRDRDFDRAVPDSVRLQRDGSYVYFSYRTTIENYLINLKVLKAYVKEKKLSYKDLDNLYFQAAKDLVFHQAMRHTLGKLRIPTDFGTNITDFKSGQLPTELSEDFCRAAGVKKIEGARSKTSGWTTENYNQIFDEYVLLFDDDFIAREEFLIYFQGKDFMKSFCKKATGFPLKDFYNYAKAALDYNEFADLVELRGIFED